MGRSRSRSPARRESRRSRSRSRERRRSRSRSRDRRRRSPAAERRRSRSPKGGRRRSPPPRRARSSSSSPPRGSKAGSSAQSRAVRNEPRAITEEDLEGKTEEEIEMLKIMGFSEFDSTKGRKVEGSVNAYAINVSQKRKYRQYMNRKGGFNRPLDFVA